MLTTYRSQTPSCIGGNAYLFQGAVSIAVEKIHDSVLKNRQNFILDGTLSNFEKAKDKIDSHLKLKYTEKQLKELIKEHEII
ncbi:TPA: hypothetical protein DEW47_02775 [Patescibacteria group bacterium]|nr:hypothetical protein [Patescibacteria group bacterium]HCI04877.1 hypothetical protein [Patescibacteria group bacterium]